MDETPIKIQLTPEQKVQKLLEICAVNYEPCPYEMSTDVLTLIGKEGKNIAITLLAEHYRRYFEENESRTPEMAIGESLPVVKESDLYYEILREYADPGKVVYPLMKKPFLVILGVEKMEGHPFARSILDDIYERRMEAGNRKTIFVASKDIKNPVLREMMEKGEVRKV